MRGIVSEDQRMMMMMYTLSQEDKSTICGRERRERSHLGFDFHPHSHYPKLPSILSGAGQCRKTPSFPPPPLTQRLNKPTFSRYFKIQLDRTHVPHIKLQCLWNEEKVELRLERNIKIDKRRKGVKLLFRELSPGNKVRERQSEASLIHTRNAYSVCR